VPTASGALAWCTDPGGGWSRACGWDAGTGATPACNGTSPEAAAPAAAAAGSAPPPPLLPCCTSQADAKHSLASIQRGLLGATTLCTGWVCHGSAGPLVGSQCFPPQTCAPAGPPPRRICGSVRMECSRRGKRLWRTLKGWRQARPSRCCASQREGRRRRRPRRQRRQPRLRGQRCWLLGRPGAAEASRRRTEAGEPGARTAAAAAAPALGGRVCGGAFNKVYAWHTAAT
jgi:hypothetical protein